MSTTIRRTAPHACRDRCRVGRWRPDRRLGRCVELCAGLSDGGLTPSAALIEAAVQLAEVHVLVRPRPGDLLYSRDEVDLVVRDIAAAGPHSTVRHSSRNWPRRARESP
ncbi:copper homeostasis protein CutC [Asanoa siamensis]|uniref:copper homeostasis protein CutC n=1 Tax=Asanoa siamensis TaxID=926357 RepID=UPI003570ED99